VSFYEVSSVVDESRQTAQNIENYSIVDYQLDAYSNKTSGKKTEAKSIVEFADEFLRSNYNMVRTVMNPVENYEDATIFRYTARYRVVIDTRTGVIYTS
jgi:hypothetical protein